jgi:LPS-assembly lipoprotein
MPTIRMPYRAARLSLCLSLCTLLAACGFNLRGGSSATALPDAWKVMYLDTESPNSEFHRELRSRFSANGIRWVDDPGDAAYILSVGPERFSQRNLSLNREARAAEFELTLASSFAILRPGAGDLVMKPTEASVVKQMENDPRNVVGKAEEIRVIKGEMRMELVQQILRRIGFFAANMTPSAG